MKPAVLLHFIEPRTKAASLIPWMFGTAYAFWAFGTMDPLNAALMGISLLCIDMATTASNHYVDYHRSSVREGYNYEEHNTMVRYGLNPKAALAFILALLGVGAVTGLLLAARTDLFVLMFGMLSFAVGLLYSWGPAPISRLPFGEAVSGIMMGCGIVFLSAYVQLPSGTLWAVSLDAGTLRLQLELAPTLRILGASVPLAAGISAIMLANNLSDLEEDHANGRITLPVLIGKRWGLALLYGLYAGAYGAVAALVMLKWVPLSCAAALLGLLYAVPALRRFSSGPDKKRTFPLAVRTFILTGGLYLLGILAPVLANLQG